MPRRWAVVLAVVKAGTRKGVVDAKSTPTRLACGRASLKASSSFATSSVRSVVSPVALPPGRARLATCPMPTGSPWVLNTIGTVLVAAKKTAVSAEEGANRTSTLRPDQLGCQLRQLIGSLPPTEAEGQVLSFGVA